jgi:hypothetical protein
MKLRRTGKIRRAGKARRFLDADYADFADVLSHREEKDY